MTTASTSAAVPRDARAAQGAALVALATALSALFYYKWSGSLRAWGGVHATGRLAVNPDVLLSGGRLAATLTYFGKIWPALVYGIVIGSLVRAALPPAWIARSLGRRGWSGALLAGVVATPLMLCSCCVTPIFTGLYERGARLSSSLAVMLGSPGLNLAALALTFALFPLKIAAARAACALAVVFGLAPLLGRMDVGARAKGACATTEVETPRSFFERFGRSLVYLTLVTVPLIAVGTVAGVFALPHLQHVGELGALTGVALVALAAVLVALPTFFEIPIGLLLLHAGLPGAALAVLVAGPIVNLPSLLVLGRETRPRLALALGASVAIIATAGGLLVS